MNKPYFGWTAFWICVGIGALLGGAIPIQTPAVVYVQECPR